MVKLKTVKEVRGTVSGAKSKVELTPAVLSDLLSALELAASLAEYVEITGDHMGRLKAIAVQDSITALSRKHKIRLK